MQPVRSSERTSDKDEALGADCAARNAILVAFQALHARMIVSCSVRRCLGEEGGAWDQYEEVLRSNMRRCLGAATDLDLCENISVPLLDAAILGCAKHIVAAPGKLDRRHRVLVTHMVTAPPWLGFPLITQRHTTCARNDLWQSPKSRPQSLRFLSADPVARRVLSALMSMQSTGSLCPYKLRKNLRLSA